MRASPTCTLPSRGLAFTAALGALWVFALVALGAFTTSIGAGMVFPDWPLSNGSLNPAGWLGDLAMFAEHSHRLSAGLMTVITLVLFVWVRWAEPRRWLRRLAGWALALVVIQAVVGGLRVLLDGHLVEAVATTLGRLFAMLHACLAQVFVCLLLALAAGLSRRWTETAPAPHAPAARRWGVFCCALLLVQLGVAAVMRHSFAGLAIPTFPWSTPEGALLPAAWDFRIGIHFAHRAIALLLAFALPVFVVVLWRDPATGRATRGGGMAVLVLLVTQIALGIAAVVTGRNAHVTTAHVLVGALTLAATFLLTFATQRSRFAAVAGGAGRQPATPLVPLAPSSA